MKKISLCILVVIVVSCKNVKISEKYPLALSKVFNKHGGLNAWQQVKTLSFHRGEEIHTSDLQSRKIVIHSSKYALGFDGNSIWIDQDSLFFKGNKDFYYNLYFYFYAMPFVLADDGITYGKAAAITYEGVRYPGVKISYNGDKGTSPDDNYILYYHPKTYQMEWLAYTVTFKSKTPSSTYHLIRYHTWQNTNGLQLPKEITWYQKDENGNPEKPAGSPIQFTLPKLSQETLAASFFEKPLK